MKGWVNLFSKIILEIKAVTEWMDKHRAKGHHYMKATDDKRGQAPSESHFSTGFIRSDAQSQSPFVASLFSLRW